MTYEIEILEPRAQKILEELANLNLIKFVKSNRKKEVMGDAPTREEVLAGLKESALEANAAIRGDLKLRSAWDVLSEME